MPALAAGSNPFATRYTRPGKNPFLFSDGLDAFQLVEKLRTQSWWGQIVGPHGSGKSTLVATLLPALEATGRGIFLITLHHGQHCLPADARCPTRFCTNTQVIVDGYEQLSCWQRWQLRRQCLRGGCGLLVTAHAPMGFSDLYRTRPEVSIAHKLVQSLLVDTSTVISPEAVERCFYAHRGNMREMFFALYDLFERSR